MKSLKINRKIFLKLSAAAIILPFFVIWDKIVKRTVVQHSKSSIIILHSDLPTGITFHESLIIFNDKNGLKIFSSSCTHLGCRINSIENDKLICPCHGSQYDFNGKVLKGPSFNSLRKLNYKIDSKTKEIIVFDA